ncbi:expressed unknown protein [Seminavis robusta]|uniref:Uncharacterized protein n=1 Tax=Seminavis robusta TaxID=568900 RepID=A0A9N8EG27_9STRA|nr:expressed unknown protein [Seminavis robusta]|eukprot:Sro1026_g232950.1 n/a (184) ;mRNA; r:33042-33593
MYRDDEEKNPKKCEPDDIRTATRNLSNMVLALADTLMDKKGLSVVDLFEQSELAKRKGKGNSQAEDKRLGVLKDAKKEIEKDGVFVPVLVSDASEHLESLKVVKFTIDASETDLVPDPMLLLIKAAINWSWRCGQKLLPACGSVQSEGEDAELTVSTPPCIVVIGPKPVPVTPVSEDDWEHLV